MVEKAKRKRKRRVDPLPHNQGKWPERRSQPQSAAAWAKHNGTTCDECGGKHISRFGGSGCNGHLRRAGKKVACTNPPINGGTVCQVHGGRLPQIKAAADRRVGFAAAAGQVAELLRECDLPDQHPIDGLLEVVRHTGGMMRIIAMLCGQLDLDPGEVKLHFSENGDATRHTASDDGLYGYDHTGDQAQHVLVIMYGQWADRYARACKLALDANIDERLVRNAESTTEVLYQAIGRALNKADLDARQAQVFSTVLAEELRKFGGPLDLLPRKKAIK
jgi:hypothetical protein